MTIDNAENDGNRLNSDAEDDNDDDDDMVVYAGTTMTALVYLGAGGWGVGEGEFMYWNLNGRSAFSVRA